MQLERYLEHFPSERILVFASEDLRNERAETVRKVLEFLEVDPDVRIATPQEEFYKTEERASMPAPVAALRRGLKRAFPKVVGLWRGRFVPDFIKRGLGRKVGAEAVASTAISDVTRERLQASLNDDVASLARAGARLTDGARMTRATVLAYHAIGACPRDGRPSQPVRYDRGLRRTDGVPCA